MKHICHNNTCITFLISLITYMQIHQNLKTEIFLVPSTLKKCYSSHGGGKGLEITVDHMLALPHSCFESLPLWPSELSSLMLGFTSAKESQIAGILPVLFFLLGVSSFPGMVCFCMFVVVTCLPALCLLCCSGPVI